eukprot:226119_1
MSTMPTEQLVIQADVCYHGIQCLFIKKLCKSLIKYDYGHTENQSIGDVLNNFHHFLKYHDDDSTFEHIYDIINSKKKHEHQYSNYNAIDEMKTDTDDNDDVLSLIMDKLHSFYYHSYDTGLRRKSNQDKDEINHSYNALRRRQKYDLNFDGEVGASDNMYSFGIRFDYEEKQTKWRVNNFYESLKDELLNNKICCISHQQYNVELGKCKEYMTTNYTKKLRIRDISKELSFSYILSLLVYCNCDEYQTKWSESFRRIPSDENDMSLKQRHSYFYHSSLNLRNLVEYFGESLVNNKNKHFYHGVTKVTYFIKTIAAFNGPMSTSEMITVAQRFSNNSGLVLQLQFSFSFYPLKSKYFSCSYLSDYTAEKECLLIGGIPCMIITNIINMSNGQQYGKYINALNIINSIFDGTYHHNVDDQSLQLCVQMVSYQLNKTNSAKSSKLPNYVSKLLHEYCNHLDHIVIFWNCIQLIPPVQQLLCSEPQCLFFNLDILFKLFPNIMQIEYFNKSLDDNNNNLSTNKGVESIIEYVNSYDPNKIIPLQHVIIYHSLNKLSMIRWKQSAWNILAEKDKTVITKQTSTIDIQFKFSEINQGMTTQQLLSNLYQYAQK